VTCFDSPSEGGTGQRVAVAPRSVPAPQRAAAAQRPRQLARHGTSIPTVNGRTSWAFEAAEAGRYTVSVTVSSQHVVGSPITVSVLPLLDPVAVAAAFSSSSSPQQSLVVEFGGPVWDPNPSLNHPTVPPPTLPRQH